MQVILKVLSNRSLALELGAFNFLEIYFKFDIREVEIADALEKSCSRAKNALCEVRRVTKGRVVPVSHVDSLFEVEKRIISGISSHLLRLLALGFYIYFNNYIKPD